MVNSTLIPQNRKASHWPASAGWRIARSDLGFGQIKPAAPLSILNLDDPQVRIERDLARQSFLHSVRLDPFILVGARPQALDAASGELRLRGRRVERRAAVEAIDLDEYCARFGCAPAPQRRDRALDLASPEIGGDPDVRAKPRQSQCAVAFAAALSSFTRRGVISLDGVRA
jgi:hypothetical protein